MKKINLLLILLTVSLTAFSQNFEVTADGNPVKKCHTVDAYENYIQQHPNAGTLGDFEKWLAPLLEEYNLQAAQGSTEAVTTIPVIFHVIHNGESVGSGDNVSAALIQAQVDQLNNDFRRIIGTSGYNTNPVGADTELEFCLATLDESGNTLAEPGINRINRNTVGWSAPPYGTCQNGNFGDAYIENTIKPQSQWNPDNYFNVWSMDISCGILGYAQFPSSSGLGGLNTSGGATNTDGVVLLATSIGSTTNPNPAGGSYNKGRTATHEVGHFFGLRHIWGDGGCSVDDFCGDTPTAGGANYGCPNNTSCSSVDMVENYMDYTDDDCMNIFTVDQKARIQTVMANSPRRGSLANSTACGGGTPPATCATTISSFPYTEGFESSLGAWTQSSADDFDWTRNSGGTPSSNTGPSSAAAGSFYAYVESSSPNNNNNTTILTSPCFDLSGETSATLDFQYHLYGAAAMGGLVLEAKTETGSWASVWSLSGNQGNAWANASVDLSSYAGDVVQLRYVGTTGTTWQGDMAIDDLSLTAGGSTGGGGCTGGITSFPYTEGFESSLGAWTQDSGDDFDWTRDANGTPSSNTGPSSAIEGTYYAFVESSSPNYSNKTTILNSPCFDLTAESSADFSFQYHNYGAAAMGSLTLEARVNGGAWASVWSVSGNQGNSWQTADVDLASYAGASMELRFVGTTGTTWQGDMAIDDISLSTSGSTGPGCTDVTVTITFDNYPEETAWSITDASGNTVASGGTYASAADGSTFTETNCLDDGCYTFNITDVYGDGICCSYGNGSYSVTDASGNTLASGGTFGASEATNFCVNNGTRQANPAIDFTPQTTEKLFVADMALFPNPVEDQLNVQFHSKWSGDVQVRVLNTLGSTVAVSKWAVTEGKNKGEIQTSQLQSGTYMLVIEKGDELLTKRFVVVK